MENLHLFVQGIYKKIPTFKCLWLFEKIKGLFTRLISGHVFTLVNFREPKNIVCLVNLQAYCEIRLASK